MPAAKVLLYCPTWEGADGLAARPETLQALKALGAAKIVIGTVNPFPGYDYRNVTAQYQNAWNLAAKYDYLLTVEHDIVPPADALAQLLAMNKPVAFGVYAFRTRTVVTNAYRWVEGCHEPQMSLTMFPNEMKRARSAGTVRVSGVGWGCTLIRADVMRQVQPRGDRDCDIHFAQDCIKNKIEMWANMNVHCAHYHGDKKIMPFDTDEVIAVHCNKSFVGRGMRHAARYEAGQDYKMPLRYFEEYRRAGYVEALS